ncbi:hypothetical protein [Microvirga rosea]|uniref:hypothetical protein n=1 Tax=Microvirga rosea TaxID=2715425 RepID=UPI001D0B819B|nr:hypothetical protein [Microvirga rosea]MCB8820173.1 hypothetical protein [Microvirga rosea]
MRNRTAITIGAVGSAFFALSFIAVPASDGPRERPAAFPVQVGDEAHTAGLTGNFDGRILFGQDSVMNANYLEGARRPVVSFETQRKDTAPQPAIERRETKDEPQKKRRPQTFGCMTAVSPLARASAEQNPSLCLAQAAESERIPA